MRTLQLLPLALFAACSANLAFADDLLYSFNFTATSGPIESFEFSLTVPTLVTVGESPGFPDFAFVVTDGTNSWGFNQDLVAYDAFCFGDDAADGPCGVHGLDYPDSAAILFIFPGDTLPTANGVYALSIVSDFVLPPIGNEYVPDEYANGNGQLTITPEPTAFVLLLTTLCLVAFVARKRIARSLSPATRTNH
jgi:hypothetical protein